MAKLKQRIMTPDGHTLVDLSKDGQHYVVIGWLHTGCWICGRRHRERDDVGAKICLTCWDLYRANRQKDEEALQEKHPGLDLSITDEWGKLQFASNLLHDERIQISEEVAKDIVKDVILDMYKSLESREANARYQEEIKKKQPSFRALF